MASALGNASLSLVEQQSPRENVVIRFYLARRPGAQRSLRVVDGPGARYVVDAWSDTAGWVKVAELSYNEAEAPLAAALVAVRILGLDAP